ncbi:hypothetical protein JHN63_51170 [Streptomyces sp. MBT65]|uniref:hypothetical protein n=1 Tax=Streptomyces sp. MBT65 TaxID=1488395 RepID=UPI0019095418|nr:hypothetical protein [Streptomyces sp. MBT65]MBK3581966.1 hypothetical protein [Streptomyces sp. MBT65]
MSAAPPTPRRHAHSAELVSRAWTEALPMTSAAPRPDSGPDSGPDSDSGPGSGSGSGDRASAGCPRAGELAARALRAHSALAQGLGQCIPVTGLRPGGGTRALAAFLAVYAAQDEHRPPTPGPAAS